MRLMKYRASTKTFQASHEIFAMIKTGLPTKFPRDCQDKQTAEYQ